MIKIKDINTKIIKDSRNNDTIETEIVLDSGIKAKTSVPQGKSKGSKEVISLPANEAIHQIQNIIKPALIDKNFSSQEDFDNFLIHFDGTKDKSRLGGNSLLALSLSFARTNAIEQQKELYRYISHITNLEAGLPKFYMNLINGGEHAHNNLDWQEYMVVVKGKTAQEQLRIGKEIFNILEIKIKKLKQNILHGDEGGYSLNFTDYTGPLELLSATIQELGYQNKVHLALDVAANSFAKDDGKNYQILNNKLSAQELNDIYLTICQEYSIISIEDPFAENQPLYYATLNKDLAGETLIVADDLTTTNPKLIEKVINMNAMSAVLIKPNQIGTLTETLKAITLAKKHNLKIIVSHRSGETMDSFIADLAYGVGAFGLKAGAPGPKERLAKYNRIVQIENNERKTSHHIV